MPGEAKNKESKLDKHKDWGGPQNLWPGWLVNSLSWIRPAFEDREMCLLCLMHRHKVKENKEMEICFKRTR